MSRAKPWKDGSCGGGGGFGNVDPKDQQRALLDQLMGSERDVPLEQRQNRKTLFTVRNIAHTLFFQNQIERNLKTTIARV